MRRVGGLLWGHVARAREKSEILVSPADVRSNGRRSNGGMMSFGGERSTKETKQNPPQDKQENIFFAERKMESVT